MKLILERHETSPQGTFGKLLLPDFTLVTGELPWRDNKSNASCLPPGIYRATWTVSPHFHRKLYLLSPTGARTGIRIHSANLMGDAAMGFHAQLNGCIALGERLGFMDKQKAVLLSVSAVRRFETAMNQQPFELEIIECWHSLDQSLAAV